MAYFQDPAVAAILQGSNRGPLPRRGENREFDQYCDRLMDNLDAEETDFSEMRKAAWATWGVGPPSRSNTAGPSRHDDEDDEIARVLALSAQEHHDQLPVGVPVEGNSEDEEELRRAIAMSEEESRAPKRQRREQTPEDERRMLAEALAASMKDHPPARVTVSPGSESEEDGEVPKAAETTLAPVPAALPSVLTGRAQMEQERLERQRQREASGQKPGSTSTAVASRSTVIQPSIPEARPARVKTMADLNARQNGEASGSASSSRPSPLAGPSSSRSKATSYHPLQSSGPFPSDAAGEYYPDGELRHTALTIGRPTDAPTFSPKQVVGEHSQIALLVMCSFVIDDEWLNQILPPPSLVPTVLIRPHPKEKHQVWNGKVQVQANGEVWSYPRMMGEWGSAHMKFFWIFYKTGRVRVVISTANMVDYDWEWIENTVFVQDFLPQKPTQPQSSTLGDEFLDRFRDLLIHMKVQKAIRHQVENHPFGKGIPLDPSEALQDLSKYDFSRVRVKLVMSVPGKYTGFEQMNEYGLCRLGNLLKEEKWVPGSGEKIEGEYQGSSLGNYTLDWIDTFYRFMNGKSARDLIGRPKAKDWPSMKVLFPSLDTVKKSELGLEGGGTMFVGQSWKSVTKRLFHDANSRRGGVLMHSKVLIAMFAKQPDTLGLNGNSGDGTGKKRKAELDKPDKLEIGGWVYVGSHNFTPSAWGNVKLNDRPPTLSINNYELGIVFPLPRNHAKEAADAIAPFKRPARPYDATDTPWDQKMKGEGRLQMHTLK